MKKILITGGAGFIGSTIINKIHKDYEIIVLDNFSTQIHGSDYCDSFLYNAIKDKCSIIKGDICDSIDMLEALQGVDYVIHLAAETGTGQSMYEINRYTEVNILGTANLLETIIKNKLPVKKIILSSSRSVYGEGMYECKKHGMVVPNSRNECDMINRDFESKCPCCGGKLDLRTTLETSNLSPISYYAYTKMAQEKMLEVMCPNVGIPYTIFRYQNVYGKGQSLNNPYTGILSIFSKLLLKDQDLNIFEDGKESRDFIHVSDVADITIDAIKNIKTDNQCINVGSGQGYSVIYIAELLKQIYNSDSNLRTSGDFRKGDIRHNVANIEKAKMLCNFSPKIDLKDGVRDFAEWVKNQYIENDIMSSSNKDFERSLKEMSEKGMLVQHEKMETHS